MIRAACISISIAVAPWSTAPLSAAPLPSPSGPVILTVSGDIDHTNGEGTASFDLEMLRSLGEAQIVTDTIWTNSIHRFSGVLLHSVLEAVGGNGSTIQAMAINDYAVEIPLSDVTETGPLIAYELDGEVMSRREKGPLWVIYPFSSAPEFRTEVIYSRSIWQLDRMHIVE